MTGSTLIEIDAAAEAALVAAAHNAKPIVGLTHNHYRYPARFSGVFAQEAINAFTQIGDLVLDPYMGGGTALVEAAAAGRDAVGVDVSSLAEFVASVKTTVFSDNDLATLARWSLNLPNTIVACEDYSDKASEWQSYRKHLDHPDRREIHRAISAALNAVKALPNRARDFGRCVVLRSAQVALDGRRKPLALETFIALLSRHGKQMVEAARVYKGAVSRHSNFPVVKILQRSSAGLETDMRMGTAQTPRLVLTSPPYPGVHILYHRWQVSGGRETAAPFWIADRLDGAGSSFYTMGDRRERALSTYFAKIETSMKSVAAICDPETVIVQMLAFGDPTTQLARYLETMEAVGLCEMLLPSLQGEDDGRLWREVPNRRWYSEKRGETPASREVVLFHRLKPKPRLRQIVRQRQNYTKEANMAMV